MGSKNQPQQEMVQVGSCASRGENGGSGTTSPFWRNKPNRTNQPSKPSESKTVIGASYSHADILKFDSLSLTPSNSRPQTPQSSNKISPQVTRTPPPKNGAISSPPKKPAYSQLVSSANSDWNSWSDDEEDEEEEDKSTAYDFDEGVDEDEFGLPSISSMRRDVQKRSPAKHVHDPGGSSRSTTGSGSFYGLEPTRPTGRLRSNSSDIALERGAPSYPSAKKTEGKILRPQYKEILRDPANSLHLISHPSVPSNATPKDAEALNTRISRINKFKRILQASNISLSELRDLAWSGLPAEVRAMSWQLLLGYLPTSSERRVATLERKRKAYLDGVNQAFPEIISSGKPSNRLSSVDKTKQRGLDETLWHQISIDVPRTSPHLQLYSYEATQRSLERILYVWAIRHPASGYVQGINDLLTPFWQVFLGSYITDNDVSSGMDPAQLPKAVLDAVEADAFWCLTKLLDGIQDNYIFAQPGIVRQVNSLKDLTTRIDSGLAKHLENEGVEFMQFSFRWMNCLLMREVSVNSIIRMWDTYMAEEQGFSDFHLYVCAAFLVKWSDQLVKLEFQDIMMFLQSLPTTEWTEKDIELLLSEAYIWQSLFRGSSAHLRNSGAVLSSFNRQLSALQSTKTPNLLPQQAALQTSTPQANKPFPFLSLPGEIRNKIYDYALISDPEHHIYYGRLSQAQHRALCHDPCREKGQPPFRLDLLLTNRQIYHEASSVFWGWNLFRVEIGTSRLPTLAARDWAQFSSGWTQDCWASIEEYLDAAALGKGKAKGMGKEIPARALAKISTMDIIVHFLPEAKEVYKHLSDDVEGAGLYEHTIRDVSAFVEQLMPGGVKAHGLTDLRVVYDGRPEWSSRWLGVEGDSWGVSESKERVLGPLGCLRGVEYVEVCTGGGDRGLEMKLEGAMRKAEAEVGCGEIVEEGAGEKVKGVVEM
ncbi:uncharacterized protein KY384_002431 [Bacidia gigantensis]|uniref:uncharacterized protein n=1 Tax=Bacidia gigantensis TaxID=2732470 RepID=UPI001D04A907|nr:uncharacterized protein KY384_002431 [Bacidia gigantensis]KAG8532554.1 hypothetical protein KY384_002431 [Bacidia gigantensis]